MKFCSLFFSKSLRFLVDGWRECKWKLSKSTGDIVVRISITRALWSHSIDLSHI